MIEHLRQVLFTPHPSQMPLDDGYLVWMGLFAVLLVLAVYTWMD